MEPELQSALACTNCVQFSRAMRHDSAACRLLGKSDMSAFRHILVATDFGRPAERAEQLGITFAERYGAKLTLLFVLSIPNSAYVSGSQLPMAELELRARKDLDAKAATLKQRFPNLSSVMRTGTPWEEIVRAATETGVDLIIVGTNGRRGLPRAVLGSVAERVVRMATVPVLTVAASADERDASSSPVLG